jgi:SAM-dependent methyltransferase
LNSEPYPFDESSADAVVSIETIERVENPRALIREMARIVRPGGWIVVTTTNQLNIPGKLRLVLRNQFPAFQTSPGRAGRITAVLEGDLRRIARECGLVNVDVHYTDRGRIPIAARRWSIRLGVPGRWFSDNVALVARRP